MKSSSLHRNSHIQNLGSYNDSDVLSNAEDTLVPMLPNGEEEVNHGDAGSNHLLNFKQSLPAPINQHAIDRIIREYNLQQPVFEQRTDGGLDTVNELSTLPASDTTSEFDYGDDGGRSYLWTNQINEKNRGEVDILAKCGDSCGEQSDYSSDIPVVQAEAALPANDEQFGKLEEQEEGRKDYYDEVAQRRRVPVAFSSLKKHSTTSAGVASKSCQSCNSSSSTSRWTKVLEHNVPSKRHLAIATANGQRKASISKSKPKLHTATNSTFKRTNNASNSNSKRGGNSSISTANQQVPNSTKPQQRHQRSETTASLDEFTFPTANESLPQWKGAEQSDDVRIFSSLKHRKKFINKSGKFLIKSVKLTRVKEEDISERLKNSTVKSFNKQRNISTENSNEFMNDTVNKIGTGNLHLVAVRRKPTSYFLHHVKKPEIEDVRSKSQSHNTSLSDMHHHIWSNSSNTENQMKLKKLLAMVPIRPMALMFNNPSFNNSSTEQHILIKNVRAKRPIRTRKVKAFDVNYV
ncbi:unnamed protein product [Litomosoides sigmodontis]|uniref:Uncharacterized protein n=1 Tax=Litomosoides sigmodontis TaxID=42156 RepID=A0A3P7JTA4_LITSI|nr:unnamed protein product [Litomosoides sigmodontis]